MKFYGENGEGSFWLPEPSEVEINSEIGVPADSMNVRFDDCEIPALWKICAVSDECASLNDLSESGALLFDGIVDEQITDVSGSGKSVTVYSRSPAAAALDNECEAGVYISPSLEVMYRRHLKRFGIKIAPCRLPCLSGELNIPRGISHYEAVRKFCRIFLRTVPRITCTGVFKPDAYSDSDILDFSNCGGIEYSRIKMSSIRYDLISGVYVGTDGEPITVSDSYAQSQGIVRERRLLLSDSSTGTLSDADEILHNGRAGAFVVRLWCSGYFGDIAGHGARVSDGGFEDDGLVVKKVRFRADHKGEVSEITLGRK